MIRDEGVKTLSGTMKENTTLTTLDLARVEKKENGKRKRMQLMNDSQWNWR